MECLLAAYALYIMKAMFLVPFMLPSFIGALAWKMLLSPNAGFINKFFINNMGFDGPIFNIYSYLGIVLVEVMYLFPFVFIQVCGALERMDPTLEESARISGAGLYTITRKITIPLVLPSILSGALLIMLYSMAHFGTVAVLGIENGIFNIPTLIYQRIHQSGGSFDSIRTGTVLATVLVVTAALAGIVLILIIVGQTLINRFTRKAGASSVAKRFWAKLLTIR